jgi:serine/threonine-protein kinase
MIVENLPIIKFDSMISLLKHKQNDKRGIFTKKPSQLNPRLNDTMDRIVGKAMAYNPEKRFPSCKAFIKTLKLYRNKHLNPYK